VKVLISGAGASGSSYIAKVLTLAGLPCGHEQVYGTSVGGGNGHADWKQYGAESSWMAMPFLAKHPGPKYLQVREPLANIASSLKLKIFDLDHWSLVVGQYRSVKKRWAREIWDEASEIERAAAWWVVWNEMGLAANPDAWWRVEAVDADILAMLIRAAGREPDPARIASALEQVPTNWNTHGPPLATPVTWDSFSPEMAERVRGLAERFGYAT
jgi:hypothetical protein